jgi:hypothetical protein
MDTSTSICCVSREKEVFPISFPESPGSSSGSPGWDNNVEERFGGAETKLGFGEECCERCLSNHSRCSDQNSGKFIT